MSLTLRTMISMMEIFRIDGVDIKDMTLKYVNVEISAVFQKVYLFNDTIENNICLAIQVQRKEVIRAAKQACCHDFIMSLPEGYQTMPNEKVVIYRRRKARISARRY